MALLYNHCKNNMKVNAIIEDTREYHHQTSCFRNADVDDADVGENAKEQQQHYQWHLQQAREQLLNHKEEQQQQHQQQQQHHVQQHPQLHANQCQQEQQQSNIINSIKTRNIYECWWFYTDMNDFAQTTCNLNQTAAACSSTASLAHIGIPKEISALAVSMRKRKRRRKKKQSRFCQLQPNKITDIAIKNYSSCMEHRNSTTTNSLANPFTRSQYGTSKFITSMLWHLTTSTIISILITCYTTILMVNATSSDNLIKTNTSFSIPLSNNRASTAAVASTLNRTRQQKESENFHIANIILEAPTDLSEFNGTNFMPDVSYNIVTTTQAAVYVFDTATAVINTISHQNDSDDDLSVEDKSEYIFDRTDVRVIFITLYTMVFCCCFFGNLLVILVVTMSRRLRSITNFFLANLALADFCVGLFCVMQNLSIYLIDSWVFGEFLCRMYQFVHSLSYTASIFILVVICMERYFAIVHPITCKQILTSTRLRMVILTVWITSAVYSTPKFVFSKTIKNVHTASGQTEEICVLDRKMFNSKLLDMINFGLLYVIPLLVMTVLYSKIAIALWRSSRGLSHHLAQQENNSMNLHNSMYQHQHHHHHVHHNHHPHLHHHANSNHNNGNNHNSQQQLQQQSSSGATPISLNSSMVSAGAGGVVGGSVLTLSRKHSSKYEKRGVSITESQNDNYKVSLDSDRPVVTTCRKTSFYHSHHNQLNQQQQQHGTTATGSFNHRQHTGAATHQPHSLHGSQRVSHISHSSNNVLRARRGVVRMLIIFVLTFALCNLPYHARKMWQYWSRSYRGDSNFNALFTPLTFLVTYFNSAINPLLYAFLSRNFRKGMKELLMCSWSKSKTKSSTNSSMHHKRMALQTHSLPTDTTHIGNEQL